MDKHTYSIMTDILDHVEQARGLCAKLRDVMLADNVNPHNSMLNETEILELVRRFPRPPDLLRLSADERRSTLQRWREENEIFFTVLAACEQQPDIKLLQTYVFENDLRLLCARILQLRDG